MSHETVEQGRYKKIYSITKKGRELLEASAKDAKKFFNY
jgi:DNA-binding PadR family transcriptional regulator